MDDAEVLLFKWILFFWHFIDLAHGLPIQAIFRAASSFFCHFFVFC
jgi:hypothetical protein